MGHETSLAATVPKRVTLTLTKFRPLIVTRGPPALGPADGVTTVTTGSGFCSGVGGAVAIAQVRLIVVAVPTESVTVSTALSAAVVVGANAISKVHVAFGAKVFGPPVPPVILNAASLRHRHEPAPGLLLGPFVRWPNSTRNCRSRR